jgi:predicted DNA-binding protein
MFLHLSIEVLVSSAGKHHVNRLTINLPAELHTALKAAAARRGTTIGLLVQESLEAYGIKPERSARDLVAAARARANLSHAAAEKLALEESRKARRR